MPWPKASPEAEWLAVFALAESRTINYYAAHISGAQSPALEQRIHAILMVVNHLSRIV
jgi:hypothetical protein